MMHFAITSFPRKVFLIISKGVGTFGMRAELLFDNYWNRIVYERYEERIIKHRAEIPAESL